jgi:glycosyltransferase involved in cell wall biosynthesis
VRFIGARPLADVLDRMRHADLFVLPCVIASDGSRDITPNALIEAMAMGLPVVSTAIGGVPEIVEDGVSGLIVPPGDAAALAGALEALIRDPERSAALGAAARRRVETKFDSATNARCYVELFAGAIGAPREMPAAIPAMLARASGD